MAFGTVSLSAALAAVESKREYLGLEEIEASLPQLRLEAKATVRQQHAASLAVRGMDPAAIVPSAELVEHAANGLLLGLVKPSEQAALARLLFPQAG